MFNIIIDLLWYAMIFIVLYIVATALLSIFSPDVGQVFRIVMSEVVML